MWGIEDYEMLYMYRERNGEEAMQNLIKKVSANVANYLSMPKFNRKAYSSTLTDEDIFAQVRIELGNALDTEPEPQVRKLGDVDGDDSVNALDVVALKRAIVGVFGENVTREACDIDNDNGINARDVVMLKEIIAS